MKHISFRAYLFFFFVVVEAFCIQDVIKLESGNNRYNFYINFEDNTFQYNETCHVNQIGNRYSSGSIRVVDDTIFLQSEYNLRKLPINIEGRKYLNECKGTVLIINNDNQFLLKDRENLFVVINNKDSLLAKSDTIYYSNMINEFFIILREKPDLYLKNYYKELPKELMIKEDTFIISKMNKNLGNKFKTETYVNNKKYCTMNVTLNVNVDLWNYQTIDDTIICKDDKYIWYSFIFDGKRFLKVEENKNQKNETKYTNPHSQ